MNGSRTAWRIVASSVAVFFFLVAMRSDIYHATSPPALSRDIFGSGVMQFKHPWWLALHIWLRKAYSVAAFTIVGYCADRALEPSAAPALRAAVVVAAYSLCIEIGQRLVVGYEPLLLSAFDVACGALGGWLGVSAGRWFARVSQRVRAGVDDAADWR